MTINDFLRLQINRREEKIEIIHQIITEKEADFLYYQWQVDATPVEQYEHEKEIGALEARAEQLQEQLDSLYFLRGGGLAQQVLDSFLEA